MEQHFWKNNPHGEEGSGCSGWLANFASSYENPNSPAVLGSNIVFSAPQSAHAHTVFPMAAEPSTCCAACSPLPAYHTTDIHTGTQAWPDGR